MKNTFKYLLILLFCCRQNCGAIGNKVADAETLFNMSFDEMMNVNVVLSSFIAIDRIKEPSSVTIITAEDIALTAYRNLNDLMEVYVPAAIWETHYDGPHIGIRGIINQRNDKILLLVNGKNMGFKAHNGPTSELENWDLSDIEKIEIIRGPGSVIYGPGAVEAVINITTKSFNSSNKSLSVGTYIPFRSKGGNFSWNYQFDDKIKLYAFASIVNTKGYYPQKGYVVSGNSGLNDLSNPSDKRQLQDYLVDTDEKPQVKIHFQLDLDENTSLWARYTCSGTTVNGMTFKLRYQTGFDSINLFTLSDPVNFNWAKNEQFVIGFSKIMNLGNNYSLNTFLSFDSENNSRSQDYIQNHPQPWAPPEPIMSMLEDPNSLRNRYFACSETEILVRSLLTKNFTKDFAVAVGFEYSYNYWGKSWFKEDGYFRLGDNWNILSDKNSAAYGYRNYFGTDSNDTYFVGNGWGTNTVSLFGEANYKINNKLTFIGSARLDKDDYTNFMFSPRLAFIYGFDDFNYLKLIGQRSVRMNIAEELLILHSQNKKPDDEQLYNLELIFTRLESSNFIINVSSFVSWLDELTWKDDLRATILSGKLNLWGLEFESRYHNSYVDINFNHAYIKQISWHLEPGVNQSGMSYSDFYYPIPGNVLTGVGNDLNNLSNNTTKLIMNFNLIDNVLIFHFDSRLYWGFQGAKDGLQMLRNALPGSKDSINIVKMLSLIEKYDTYGADFRLNAAIRYSPIESLTFSLNAMNILDLTNNRRLRYDTGAKLETPDLSVNFLMKNSLIIEPLTIGLSVRYKF
ncbi:MAG: TonB-dependent receptor [Candidatus Kapabacteria bacterium]|nr:TonB-dependent receptor [Candidatus Kapabacteria bacterium]